VTEPEPDPLTIAISELTKVHRAASISPTLAIDVGMAQAAALIDIAQSLRALVAQGADPGQGQGKP
jgi:hypothetical protein